jgi:hypothetical protein
VIFAYQTKLNISRKKRATKILPKRVHTVILNYLCNAIKKTFGEISLHRHFKLTYLLQYIRMDEILVEAKCVIKRCEHVRI